MTKRSGNFNIAYLTLLLVMLFSYSTLAVICPLGDLDGNCKIDLVDVQKLVGRWLDPSCTAPGCEVDLVAGGGVNLIDYAWMAANHDKTGVHVVISEFMADNEGSFLTQLNGQWEHPDWIEIYNPSDVTVDLGGCFLTDNPGNKTKWPFPPGTILAGNSYLVVFASKQEDTYPFIDDLGYLHTNFKLDKDGDYLALVLPDGSTVEHQFPITYPDTAEYSPQYDDWSYGLSQDLLSEGYFFPATPGMPNNSNPIADPTKNIFISEIMYHPYHVREESVGITPEPVSEEYIEIYNRGIESVDLADWRLANGVSFTIPAIPGVVLDPNAYLVIAADVSIFNQTYTAPPGVTVVGGWDGKLSNRGEEIELEDENGLLMDRVIYADEGEWAERELGPEDHTHRGWRWKDDHDGDGKSLELIHPGISNNFGQNWSASLVSGGTPGAANSVSSTNIAPMILDVKQRPYLPKSNEAVRVTVRIRDEQASGHTVKLYYRVDTSDYNESNPADQDVYPTFDPGSYTEVLMLDDGVQDNGRANDGVFGAQLPAQPEDTIVEFFVEASDGSKTRTWPAPADVDGTLEKVTNCLYQVYAQDSLFDPDDEWIPGSRPVYHIVMTNRERLRLKDIGNDGELFFGEGWSNAQMNGTFISFDGVDSKLRYNVGIRNRGNRSRVDPPNNYRVNFRRDDAWKGIAAININSKYAFNQVMGSALWQWAGLPAMNAQAVQVRVNGDNEALNDSNMRGSYAAVEAYDNYWPEKHIPGDDNGNLYRCSYYQPPDGGTRTYADLEHKGDPPYRDPDDYRDNYRKQTNASEDDWTDLFDLIDDLMDQSSPDDVFLANVSQEMNPEQWLRFLAVDSLSGNQEGGLASPQGDDYAMYRGIVDPRFMLCPHDLDTVLGQGDNPLDYTQDIFVYDSGLSGRLAGLHRLLNHPVAVREYFHKYLELIDTVYSPEHFDPLIERVLGGIISDSTINQMKNFVVRRINDSGAVLDQVKHAPFSVSSDLPVVSGYNQTTSATVTGNNISGEANAAEVLSVLVNGQVANNWSQRAGTWSLGSGPAVDLLPGINRVIVQTFDGVNGTGNELERQTIDIWYDDTTIANVPNPLTQTNTILDAASGPWYLGSNLTVPSGYTLTIEPGTTVYFNDGVRVTVNGQLLAEGSDYQRIHMTATPGSGATWSGISFSGTTQDNRLCYVDMERSDSGSNTVSLSSSKALLDNVTWTQTNDTILSINSSSAIVRNCIFPDNASSQTISGSLLLSSDPYLILEGNIFGVHTGGKQDVLDFSTRGSSVPPQFIHNVFLGGGDDALDMDDTWGYVDGNVFMNFHRNFSAADGEAYAVSSGDDEGYGSRHMIVRNLFINCDHAALVKDQSWIHFENNTLINCSVGINFDEPSEGGIDPGLGAYLDGNIFWNVGTPLAQFYVDHPTWGTTDITVNRSILPSSWHSFGEGNIDANPLFVDELNEDYHLRAMSPALGNGDNGIDIGCYVPEGTSASVKTYQTEATVTVAGPGITHYQYVIGDPTGSWSSERSVDEQIELTGLTNETDYTVYTRGKTYAGVWRTDPNTYGSVSWTVDASEIRVQINEVLAINRVAVEQDGMYPDMIELYNDGPVAVNLDGMSISDDSDFPTKYVFSGGVSLDPNQYLVLTADPNTANPLYLGFALDGGGEGVYLYNSSGGLIDLVEFGPQIPDLSIGRYTGGRWQLTVPTFGQANVVQKTGDWQTLKINEWLASEKVLFADDFIELYNPEANPVEVSALYLTDNPVNQRDKNSLGPLAFVGGAGYVVFEADDLGGAGHVDFQLSAQMEMIGLYDEQLNEIDKVIYGSQTTDVSEGRDPDGELAYAFFELPTPGLPNTAAGTQPTTLHLVTAGMEVKYFVPSDSTWENTWMNPTFTDLQSWTTDTTVLGFGEVFGTMGVTRVAYNDCFKQTGDDTANNVTDWTIYNGYTSHNTGTLIDFDSGEETDMPTVTFSMGAEGIATSSSSGGQPEAGTPMYEVFHNNDGWIVDFAPGLIYYGSPGWWLEITFTDLNPNAKYTFAGSAIRSSDYPLRMSLITILDADGYVWNSSGGVGGSGDTATFQAGDNSVAGEIIRWDDIVPGADGDFTIRSEAMAGSDQGRAYPINGFMLEQEGGEPNNPLQLAMVGTNATLWTRIEFDLDTELSELTSLTLKMRYEDAFVAYLNGTEVTRSNLTGTPLWNSQADGNRDNTMAANFDTVDISSYISALQPGTNVLAVQVLNESIQDPNLVFLPELTAVRDPNDGYISYEDAIDLLHGLRITELMYHPQDKPASHPDVEFIELKNVGAVDLNLSGVRFTNGIDFTFPAMILSPDDYVVIVKDQTIFQSQYGVIPEVIGEYDGSLSNGGENIVLKLPEPLEAAILRFEYNDAWYPTTDGGGYALVINDPLAPAATWDDRDYWSAGTVLGGSPGTTEP